MAEKKYYWLKLKKNFFNQPKIKKLRRIAGGDTYTVIYLKLQLLSIENEGMLYFEGIEDDFIDELALTIDEDVENVRFTVMFLISQNLMEEVRKDEYALPEAMDAIGSENASAERKRRSREKKKMLGENRDNVTALSQGSHGEVTKCHTELELEKELEKEREDRETTTAEQNDLSTVSEIIQRQWKRKAEESDIEHALKQLERLNGDTAMLSDALEIAAQHGERAKNWKYTTAIIDSWIRKGYTCEEDVLMNELKRKGGI